MEDQFYRQDAGRFRLGLKIFFTLLMGMALLFLTAVDFYYMNAKGEEVIPEQLREEDKELNRITKDQYMENTRNSLIMRFVILFPLIIFGYRFFNSDR